MASRNLPREIRTERLLLRRFLPSDRAALFALNSDPRVTEFLPAVESRAESDTFAERLEAHFEDHGFGRWAVEVPGVVSFAGYIGLAVPRFEAHFTPCVEVGWWLASDCWGRGYASEGARAALAFGFETLALDEIVSFTVPANVRSRRVMEKMGMTHDPSQDFDHPALPEGHPLRRHVLYRVRKARLLEQRARSRAALESGPARGRVVLELRRLGMRTWRELVVRSYRLVYRIEGETKTVLAVFDGRRDLADVLLDRLLRMP